MNRVLILGAFGYTEKKLDGQTIKTRDILRLFKENYNGDVVYFDTLKVKKTKNPLLLCALFGKLLISNVVVIAPASHSMAKFFPTVYYLSKVLNYDVIVTCVGGWQIEFFLGGSGYAPHPHIMKISRAVKGFLPEIGNINTYLKEKLHFTNVAVFPNFRYVSSFEKKVNTIENLKIVYMGRIDKRKGYDTIFSFVDFAKSRNMNVMIDFYGQIETKNYDDFLGLVESYQQETRYLGPLNPQDIHTVLSGYDVLVLPTNYYTEGFPGSILDAYISGIPVVVTEWKHSHEFVVDGRTGFIVPFTNSQKYFNESLLKLYSDKSLLKQMKQYASEESLKYSPSVAWQTISKFL